MTAWERLADAPFEKNLASQGGGRWRVVLSERDVDAALPMVVEAFSAYRVPYPDNRDRVACFEVDAVKGTVVFTARRVQGFMVSHAPDDLVWRYLVGTGGGEVEEMQLSITSYTPEQMAGLYAGCREADREAACSLSASLSRAVPDLPELDALRKDADALRLLGTPHPSFAAPTRSEPTP